MSSPLPTPPLLHGSCACAQIRYTSTSLPTRISNCHCTSCRKRSGSPFITWADLPAASLTWTSRPTTRSSEVADRGHCAACGSTLTMAYFCQPGIVGVAVGTVDEVRAEAEAGAGVLRPRQHVFVSEKAAWFELLDDGLEAWGTFSPGFRVELERWREGREKGGRGGGCG